ncbi:MAG: YraN family protein [Burkholderiales bacterium]
MKAEGDAAEDLALAHLLAKGCRLEQRNYRCRFGEIDLIMVDRGTLVFVEVRKRSDSRFGSAAESITAAKRNKLVITAQHYLARSGAERACRFDAVLIDGQGRVEWLRDAFGG